MRDRSRTSLSWLAAGLVALAPWAGAAAQETEEPAKEIPPQRTFQITRATSEIKVDGVLDEPAWESALVIPLEREWFPGDNVEPPVRTDSLISFDSNNLYVAFKAFDPEPSQIRSHLMDRDDIGQFIQDDHVGFVMDTFNDERRGFHFRVNPDGVQIDAIFSERTAAEDYSWDAIWDAAAKITSEGYIVEIAIPLRQLRFPRGEAVQTWGYEAFRSYPRNVRHRISTRYTDRAKDCLLCQEDKIAGFEGLKTGRNIEFTPTLTGIQTEALDAFPDGDFQTEQEDVEAGASLRWGVTPNVTLNATINPDFSQVEADVAQLDINRRFALFFPEKRPFFLEGAELFLTPLQAVFTRTVADPRWGGKFSAKQGANTLGLFVAQDRINNILIPGNQGSRFAFLDQEVETGVMRYTREIGKASALGVLYTGREGDGYHNRVAGLDGFLRFTPSDTLRVQYLNSDTEYPGDVAGRFGQPDGSFDGNAVSVRYDHFAPTWKVFGKYEDLDEGFRADAGFLPRVDIKTAEAGFIKILYGEKDDWYAQMSYGVNGLRSENQAGLLTNEEVELFWTYNGPRQSFLRAQVFDNREFLGGTTFDIQQLRLFGQFAPSGNSRASLAVWTGDDLDVENTRAADLFLISPNILLRLGKSLSVEVDYLRQELDVQGGRLFAADQVQTNVIYNFNVRTFVRGIFQYTRVDRDPSLYLFPVRERTETSFAQLLFSYKINPQTVLFVGYTDGRFGTQDVSLTQTDRTLFLKLGYAFLF